MHKTLDPWRACTLFALIALGFAPAAQASTIYDFTFTNSSSDTIVAKGSFTTDGSADASGFEALTFMSFDYATTTDGTVYTGPFTTSSFNTDAGYNPTTKAFISTFRGRTENNLGRFGLRHDSLFLNLDDDSFEKSGFVDGFISGLFEKDLLGGSLIVGPGAEQPPPPPTVPEPTSVVLLGSGLLGAVIGRRRARTA